VRVSDNWVVALPVFGHRTSDNVELVREPLPGPRALEVPADQEEIAGRATCCVRSGTGKMAHAQKLAVEDPPP
jgi:hypothetical protein